MQGNFFASNIYNAVYFYILKKYMRTLYILTSILLLFNACTEKTTSQDEQKEIEENSFFYKHLTGTIDNKGASMDITVSYDSMLNGYVYVEGYNFPLYINGTWNTKNIVAYIDSSEDNRNVDQDYVTDSMVGSWQNEQLEVLFAGKKCIMKERYDDGSFPFALLSKEDSTVDPKSKKTISNDKVVMPLLKDQSMQKWFNQQLYMLMGDTTFDSDIKKFIAKHTTIEIPNDTDELNMMIEMPYYGEFIYQVLYNKNNRIGISLGSSTYYGGAHPFYSESYINLDMKNKKILSLSDILDQSQLKRLPEVVKSIFRKKYLPNGEPFTDICFEEEPPLVNDNYLITDNGIKFFYNQYEIAAYAAGVFSVFVPFEAIKN